MQPNYNHNQGPNQFFVCFFSPLPPLLEANYHKWGVFACWIKIQPFCFFFFSPLPEHSSSSGLRRNFKKCLFSLKMWSWWNHLFFVSVFVMRTHFETHSAHAITVTAYYNAPWHYKCLSLWQCFTGICVYAYLTVQSSLVSKGRLKPTFHFRYRGTIKDLMLKRSLCSQNGLLSPVDRFVGLGVFLPLTPFCKRSWCFFIVPAPQRCPFFLTFFFVLLRCIFQFLSEDQCFLQLIQHSIYPIWPLSFQVFGHYSPLLKKKSLLKENK